MRIIVDRDKMRESTYDKRHLAISQSGKNRYPSKKMFVEFLKQFTGIRGTANIWSERDLGEDSVTIHVDLKYKPASRRDVK